MKTIHLDSRAHYPAKFIQVNEEEEQRLDDAKEEHGCIADALRRDKEFAEWYDNLLEEKERITFKTYTVYA